MVAASVVSLCETLGCPMRNVPNALSLDKFAAISNHLRKWSGFNIDTRALTVDMLDCKLEQVTDELQRWQLMAAFSPKEAAQLVGLLESMSRCNKWGRAWFFELQNAMREIVKTRHHVAVRISERKGTRAKYEASLPTTLRHRIESLVSKETANCIWCARTTVHLTPNLRLCINLLHDVFSNRSISWAAKMPFIILRDPHAVSAGDASEIGGGGHNHKLRCWFDVIWSAETLRRIALPDGHKDKLQINVLEFAMVVLQFAAFVVRLDTLSEEELLAVFPDGMPVLPVLLCVTDSTASKSWAARVTSKSRRAQSLIAIFAQFLRACDFGINCQHVAGVLNLLADFVSRPAHICLSHAERAEQICQSHPFLRTCDCFLPSPELLQLLTSALFTSPSVALPDLPSNLGRFVPAGFIISHSPAA